jgi:hypothetical protein
VKIGQARRQARVRLLAKARSLPGLRRYPATAVSTAVEARRLSHDLSTVRSFLMFVGHPRSGHSLVGVLLDAHPNVLVAHELDVLKYVEAGFGREQLFVLLRRQERARAARGQVTSADYAYGVPGQWQGRYRRLDVIGDKKGGKSTLRLGDRPELLDRLAATVVVPVKIIQVVRNPYDNIATMHRRAPRASLAHHVEQYFHLAAIADTVRMRIPAEDYHGVHLEDLIADPATTLAGLCSFLDVAAEPDYIEACASIVFPTPRQTRANAPWTPELLATVEARMADHPVLARYRDTDSAPAPTTASSVTRPEPA